MIFYCTLGILSIVVGDWVLLKSFCFFRQSHSLGLTCRSWPIFVSCSFNDGLIFSLCGVILVCWFIWFPLAPLVLCLDGKSFCRLGCQMYPCGRRECQAHELFGALLVSISLPVGNTVNYLGWVLVGFSVSVSSAACVWAGARRLRSVGDKEAWQARLLFVVEFSLKVQHSYLGVSWG